MKKNILKNEQFIVSLLQLAIAASYAIEAICVPAKRWYFVIVLIWFINAFLSIKFWIDAPTPKADLIFYGALCIFNTPCLFACRNGFDYVQIISLLVYSVAKMLFARQVLKSPRIKKKTRRIPVEPDWSFKHLIEELVRKDCKRFSFKNYDVVVDGKVLSESELEKPIWQMADAIKEFDLVPKIKE